MKTKGAVLRVGLWAKNGFEFSLRGQKVRIVVPCFVCKPSTRRYSWISEHDCQRVYFERGQSICNSHDA